LDNPQVGLPWVEQAEDDPASFFERSLDLQCVAGLDGYFKRLNPAWTALLGWTVKELSAKPFIDFVHPDDRETTVVEIARLAAGAPASHFQNRYRDRDGSYHWLEWNARPAREHQCIYATARDTTRQKFLEREILEILDRERERLGSEMHDGVCQSLAGIAALSAALSKRLAVSSAPKESAAAAEIANLLKHAIAETRDLAHGLGPVDLQETGIAGALENLTRDVRRLFQISCTLECDLSFPVLRYETGAHLFRITQEAVRNAITHGQAGEIEISMSVREGQGVLTVQDNGCGLPEVTTNRGGIGMYTMDYRARLIGGSLDIVSPGAGGASRRGTVVTCRFPLPRRPTTD
jgi:PAS domain S-box-containing protein